MDQEYFLAHKFIGAAMSFYYAVYHNLPAFIVQLYFTLGLVSLCLVGKPTRFYG